MSVASSTVVLGGGYAGVLAAIKLARSNLDVTLVSSSRYFCERIRLHQFGTGQSLSQFALDDLLTPAGVKFRCAHVMKIDLAAKRLELRGGEVLGFDQLVLAAGSVSDRSRVAGAQEHALSITDPQGAARLSEQVATLGDEAARVLVVGAGLTGIELASELAESHPGLRVTLTSPQHPGQAFSKRGQRHLRRVFERLEIELKVGCRVEEITSTHALLENGESIKFERCLWAGSSRGLSFVGRSGLLVAPSGRVVIDQNLRSRSHPFVSVAGDAGIVFKTAERASAMSCQLAMPMGAYVGSRLAREARGLSVPPFRFRAMLRCVSLGRKDAIVQGLRGDETPLPVVITGRVAAKIKEQICRMTVNSFDAECRGTEFRWVKGKLHEDSVKSAQASQASSSVQQEATAS